MIRIRWSIVPGHFTLDVSGHEPNAVHGSAIVCAAVSAITQGFVAVLQAISLQNPGTIDILEEQVDR